MTDKELLEAAARAAGVRNKPRVDGRPLIDPIGSIFGRLTVLREVGRKSPRKRRFYCVCSCGAHTEVDLNKLRTGHVRSCGCLHLEALSAGRMASPRNGTKKHGMNKSPEHRAWVHMRQRCNNPEKREWMHYGGRGILVCDRWSSFENFIEDMGPRPSSSHSIDRIDVNGNYEPSNCRWATKQQQAENTLVVRMVELDGVTHSISAWERKMGLSKGQVNSRLSRGWSMRDAILRPSIAGQKFATRRAIVRAAAAMAKDQT